MWFILFGGGHFGKNVQKYGKTTFFSRRLWPDWENTIWAFMAGLGSIGLNTNNIFSHLFSDDLYEESTPF